MGLLTATVGFKVVSHEEPVHEQVVLAQQTAITPTPVFTPVDSPQTIPTPIQLASPTPIPTPVTSPTPTPTQVIYSPSPYATTYSTLNEVKSVAVGSPLPSPTISPLPSPTSVVAVQVSSQQINEYMDKYAGQYGVDVNVLRHVALCESGFNPQASNLIYAGLFQFSPSTWRSYRNQMGEDNNIDLRFNAEEAVQTAAYVLSQGRGYIWPNCLP